MKVRLYRRWKLCDFVSLSLSLSLSHTHTFYFSVCSSGSHETGMYIKHVAGERREEGEGEGVSGQAAVSQLDATLRVAYPRRRSYWSMVEPLTIRACTECFGTNLNLAASSLPLPPPPLPARPWRTHDVELKTWLYRRRYPSRVCTSICPGYPAPIKTTGRGVLSFCFRRMLLRCGYLLGYWYTFQDAHDCLL